MRIDTETIRVFFSTAGGPEPDLPWPAADDIACLAAGAEQRRQDAAVPDDPREWAA